MLTAVVHPFLTIVWQIVCLFGNVMKVWSSKKFVVQYISSSRRQHTNFITFDCSLCVGGLVLSAVFQMLSQVILYAWRG